LNPIWNQHKSAIEKCIEEEIHKYQIFPPLSSVFNAFTLSCPAVKVVIIGQDPYHNKGEAHGLAFSVQQGKMPPSLRNIFKELNREYGIMRTNTDLSDWASQGVLLLNTALTVRENCPGSHIHIWKPFTSEVIKMLGGMSGIVFMLWGKHAQQYECMIDNKNNLVLKHSHPSPLARKSFIGNNHFSQCNAYLITKNKTPITWV